MRINIFCITPASARLHINTSSVHPHAPRSTPSVNGV